MLSVNETELSDKVRKCVQKYAIEKTNHLFNPLHIYCRLCDINISPYKAKRLTRVYENYIYKTYNKLKYYMFR